MSTILQLIIAAAVFLLTLTWVVAHLVMGHLRTPQAIAASLSFVATTAVLAYIAWYEHKHPDRP